MHVEVHDPSEKQVMSRAYGSTGRVSYLLRVCKIVASTITVVFHRLSAFFCVDFLAKRTICGISGQKSGQSLDIFPFFCLNFIC